MNDRDREIMATTTCPLCGAQPGKPCTWPNGSPVSYIHPLRREAGKGG